MGKRVKSASRDGRSGAPQAGRRLWVLAACGVVVVAVATFLYLVWPTPYVYGTGTVGTVEFYEVLPDGTEVTTQPGSMREVVMSRRHRITGKVEYSEHRTGHPGWETAEETREREAREGQ